jgi:aminoglycoside phosphotransferase (APT) family kinase protein
MIMESITKRTLTPYQIQEIFRTAFGDAGDVADLREFTNGWFAAVHGVTLTDGRELVLKVAPDPGLKLLRYEVDLSNVELEFHSRARVAGVPVPEVHYAEPDNGYLVMQWLPGRTLDTIKDTLTPEQDSDVRRQLGAAVARLHTITSPYFGYPRRDGHTHSGSWRTTFLTFIDDILADAREHGQDRHFPQSAAAIDALIRRHAAVLDEVTTPALVHFDLWDGNIFVRPEGERYLLTGIIDGERAFYGDPLADFVHFVDLATIDDPQVEQPLLETYFGGPRRLTDNERLRVILYTSYLDLIMLTEGAVRQYDPAEYAEVHKWVYERLERHLALL